MATTNYYAKLHRAIKTIFEADERTAMIKVYGADNIKKAAMPCMIIIPESKEYLEDDDDRPGRRIATPRKAMYKFNLFVYVNGMQLEDAYFNTATDGNMGLTQAITEIEAVIKDNKTGNDPDDDSVRLWYDVVIDQFTIDQIPGKVLNAVGELIFRRTETI